jgi:hypothetical protein
VKTPKKKSPPSPFFMGVILCFISLSSYAQSNYVAFQLAPENNFAPLITEDLNGDGAKDIVISHYQVGLGRELHIHHQQADGSFASTPQRIEIKTEIIAVGFADVREPAGMELILFAANGVFSLSTAIDGYAGNIKQLMAWDMIATVPNLERVLFIDNIVDINADGLVDLLLPGDDIYGYFEGTGSEQFELVSTFSTVSLNTPQSGRRGRNRLDANISINPEQGVVVEIDARSPSPFANYIEQWGNADVQTNSLLRSEKWMPAASLALLNDDELLDIAYINVADDGLGQLNIHYQSAATGFADTADWSGSVETSGDLRFIDLNNDQQLDLYRLSGNGDEWDARFFLNQGGEFDLQKPSQIMRFSGYDVQLNFIDIPGESRPVLNVSYYTVPVIDVIRNASINRIQLLYGSNQLEPGRLFNRQPDSQLQESFSAANVRGLSEQMSMRYDIDGDGQVDALYITENGTLAAKKIGADLVVADQPFWEYISSKTVFEFEVMNLNEDSRPDLLLRHGTATTILVAIP